MKVIKGLNVKLLIKNGKTGFIYLLGRGQEQ
jgi:hypothetical protein